MSDIAPDSDAEAEIADLRRRLRGFGLHLLAYFVAMAVLVPVNLFGFPATLWFPFPMVGWGAFLAIYAAYAMGLLDVLIGDRR